jgi:SAM-dependent methyltransferase
VPAVVESGMRRFWDRAADEDAFFFVDNRLDYGRPDLERFWAVGERELQELLDAVAAPSPGPDDDVVEIGCGVGRLTRALAKRARTVRALDISERMLALAREHNPDLGNVEWVHGDGASLAGVEDASADACVSHVVFQHIPDPAVTLAYVREIGRVLRPGGWAAFQLSNDPSVHRPRGGFRVRARALLGRGPRGQGNPAWLGSAVDLEDLRQAADTGGLALERVVGEGTQYCCVLARRR